MHVILLFGNSGSGKTTLACACAQYWKQKGRTVGGIVAPGTFMQGKRFSFDVMDIETQERECLCSLRIDSPISCGPFGFSLGAIEFGYRSIRKALSNHAEFVILDEVGPLELQGMGWDLALKEICSSSPRYLVLTARPSILEDIVSTYFPHHGVDWISVLDPRSFWETL